MVLSTEQGLITSRKVAVCACAGFISERRVPTVHPECLAQLTASLPATRNARRFQFVVLLVNYATAIDRTPVVPAMAKFPAPLQTRLLPRGDHCMISGFCSINWFAAATLRMPSNPLFTICYLIFTTLFINYPVIRRCKI